MKSHGSCQNLTNFSLLMIILANFSVNHNFKCLQEHQPWILEACFSKFSGGVCPQTPLESLVKPFSQCCIVQQIFLGSSLTLTNSNKLATMLLEKKQAKHRWTDIVIFNCKFLRNKALSQKVGFFDLETGSA